MRRKRNREREERERRRKKKKEGERERRKKEGERESLASLLYRFAIDDNDGQNLPLGDWRVKRPSFIALNSNASS